VKRWLPAFSVHRPVTVVMGFLALLVLGAIAWQRIPLEAFPSGFVLNKLWVFVPYGDAAPRETERAVLRPMEEHLSTAPGVKDMNGRAGTGSGRVRLEFHRSVGMDVAYNAVVDRMERAMADLPDDVENYYVWKWDPNDTPVLWAGVAVPDEVEDAHQLMTEVVAKRLERVPGVGQVDVWGVDAKAVFVDFRLDDLLAHNISLGDVIQTLSGDNFQLASGRIVEDGKVRYVRSLARWETVEELERTPIGGGLVVADIANVEYRLDLTADINHIDGKEGAGLSVRKESDANTVAVTAAVQEAMRELEDDPRMAGGSFVTFFDQGEVISSSVGDLLSTAATGGVCAVIVLFIFLRQVPLTLLIAACIPFTLLLTVTLLYFTGGTLNLLSLMGLMLAVGMVVDNAIVVVESIYARRQGGEDARIAAVEGAADVNLAITLSTLTTMVVFLPVILMSEDANFSFFMGQIGMPVVWALGASLLVALVFTPVTTTLLGRRKKKAAPEGDTMLPTQPRWITWLTTRYRLSLAWVLANRADAAVGILAFTMLTVILPGNAVSCEGGDDGGVGEFQIRFEVPADFTYKERLAVVETFEEYVEQHRDEWGVKTHQADLNASRSSGRIQVYLLEDREDEQVSRTDVIEAARKTLPEMAGVDAQIGWNRQEGNDQNTLTVTLRGDEMATLEALGEQVQDLAKALPGVGLSYADMEEGAGEEMRLYADREALARYGLSATSVGQTVGFALRGTRLPDFHDGGKEVDVAARFQYEDRADMDRLLDFPLWSPATMRSVPLRAVVDPVVAPGTGSIWRENRVTGYPVTVELDPEADPTLVREALTEALAGVPMPRGYSYELGGRFRQQDADLEATFMALGLSIVFVFLIMGVLFESFLLPLSIITSIPMAMVGVYWTLYLSGTPLDVMGQLGIVVLVGVVVNNGIVLVDLVTRLRKQGEAAGVDRVTARTAALVKAGGERLRPILMTALTTIFGLLPMALGTSSFLGMPYAPLGRVVAGGMVAGTILTLFLVPYLYTVLDDVRDSASRWLRWVVGRGATAPEPGAAK
jgi:hydrophobic/amphiphilic exporter-1 (mainly G- bacteria), HAE1 family